MVWLAQPGAYALQQTEYGGNTSSDYQPLTRNPQGNTITGLQPTNSSDLQTPSAGINPQSLVLKGGLKVLTSPANGAGSTAPNQVPTPKPKSTLPIWIIGGLLSAVAFAYVLLKPDSKDTQRVTVATKSVPADKPLTPKNRAKKTTRKKRKQANK